MNKQSNPQPNLDERERLRVLHDYGVLDSPPDPVFDDLTALAAKLCDTPISLISLVDADRQWFKSHHGLDTAETPRSLSFCSHTIRHPGAITVIPDARADPRFADNPLVVAGPQVRFYAASPLRTPEGYPLGTLCVLDRKPRALTSDQLNALEILARQAMSQIELRRALNALRASEERFHSVARAVNDVIWEWDVKTGRLWWSEGFETTFGFPPEETPVTLDLWAERVHPDDRTCVVESLRRAIASGAKAWRHEYRFRRHDGTYAIVHDRGEILRDAQGHAYRICGGMSDVSELRQFEAQSLRAQRMESIGALAGGIAHDLNNVLTPILMSAGMLKESLARSPAELQLAQTIEKSAIRGANLVRQIVSFARGAKGPYQPTSVRSVLTDAVQLATETFPRSIAIDAHLSDQLWQVRGNATHLHQVFMNLFVNARDAMPNGGQLTITAVNAQLPDEVCAPFKRKGGPYVLVTVRDAGVGIPPEVQERIFEPFFTTKPQGVGTGLGLSTAHGIVANHGGFMRVRSAAGAGTTFEVCLPAEPQAEAETVAGASPSVERGRDELILLVDDEDTIRMVARKILELHGYRVLLAENGADALTRFAEHQNDIRLVLMDLMMPVMDGVTCIGELRKIKPDVRIIVATGGLQPGFARALPPGIPVLAKPYLPQALLTIVRQTLDKPAV